MACYRCNKCSINYPPAERNRLENKCPRCKEGLEYFTNKSWDTNWREKVEQGDPLPWGPHPDDDACTIIYRNDTDTIHVLDTDLRALGYLPVSGDVVKLNGKYYELLGFSLRGRIWWLEPFTFEPTSRQIKRAKVWTGPSSDDIIALDNGEQTLYYDPRTDPFSGEKEATE